MKELNHRAISKWLVFAYAGGVILFFLRGADAPDVVLLSFLFLPWIVGPAALAARGVGASTSKGWAWAFLILEALIVVSTVLLWIYLIVIAPDAQNGIAMMLFPVVQYGVVLGLMLLAVVFSWLARRG